MRNNTRNGSVWAVCATIAAYVRAEPVAFQGVIQAGLALLIGFGLVTWTAEQTGLALALTAALLGFVARRHVTPNAKAASKDADTPVR
ncbi:hypothetical protein [Actinophytocola sp.]|jgi:hypothetical protein|uniref:hypothetical protein n=1 Tax=Actinophytocola sp. TaxID=1872138 RepID=UPI002ED87F74